jgi:hypothetical protein
MENPWTDLCADVAATVSIAGIGVSCVMVWVHPLLVDLALGVSVLAGAVSLFRNIKGAHKAPPEAELSSED